MPLSAMFISFSVNCSSLLFLFNFSLSCQQLFIYQRDLPFICGTGCKCFLPVCHLSFEFAYDVSVFLCPVIFLILNDVEFIHFFILLLLDFELQLAKIDLKNGCLAPPTGGEFKMLRVQVTIAELELIQLKQSSLSCKQSLQFSSSCFSRALSEKHLTASVIVNQILSNPFSTYLPGYLVTNPDEK